MGTTTLTPQVLKTELERRGFRAVINGNSVMVFYTSLKPTKGYSLNALEVIFETKLIDTENTCKGFLLSAKKMKNGF